MDLARRHGTRALLFGHDDKAIRLLLLSANLALERCLRVKPDRTINRVFADWSVPLQPTSLADCANPSASERACAWRACRKANLPKAHVRGGAETGLGSALRVDAWQKRGR